ncbi:MAG: lipid A-modifier LpxR family protein [Pseudomonadota bacterium]
MIAGHVIAVACLGCFPSDDGSERSLKASIMGPTDRVKSLRIQPAGTFAPIAARSALVAGRPAMSPFAGAMALSSPEQAARLKIVESSEPAALRFEETESWTAGVEFTAPAEKTGLGLDVSVAPHATIEEQGRLRTARAGAEVRLGQNIVDAFDKRGTRNSDANSWYMFAGADGEALCWDLGDKGASWDGVALRDQITVGDLQAGVAIVRGGGQLSLGYVRREYSVRGVDDRGYDTVDNFAALSFTMRR